MRLIPPACLLFVRDWLIQRSEAEIQLMLDEHEEDEMLKIIDDNEGE